MFISGLSVKIEEYPLFNIFRLVLTDFYVIGQQVTRDFSSKEAVEEELERLTKAARRFIFKELATHSEQQPD